MEDIIDIKQMTRQVVSYLLEKKARNIVIIDVENRASYCDRLVVCTGSSARQVRALAEHAVVMLKKDHGFLPLGREGRTSGTWVLVDLGSIVLHVFDENGRTNYDLDGLWIDAPRVSLGQLGLVEDLPEVQSAPFL